jgi:hypothetical protein
MVIGVGLDGAVAWLRGEGPNPYSCAVMGEIVSVSVTFIVSKLTQPLPEAHLQALFSEAQQSTGGAS